MTVAAFSASLQQMPVPPPHSCSVEIEGLTIVSVKTTLITKFTVTAAPGFMMHLFSISLV